VNVGPARLANQHISRPPFRDPADVVRWLGAVQAQDYVGGLWAIGLRTKGATEATVEDAVARRTIVRTWPMRGTLHFVAAEDVRWILPILTPRVIAGAQGRFRQLGLDAATFTKSARVAEKALVGGNVVRRDQLYEIWNAAGIATHESRGLHLLGVLSQQGLLCFGPRDGKQHTFTLLEEWVPAVRTLDGCIAAGEAGRYDFAFIDADKSSYDAYYERCLQLLRPGGLIAIDNVLWGGSVARPSTDTDTRALQDLNDKLHRDERIDIAMLPVGDGLTLARKR